MGLIAHGARPVGFGADPERIRRPRCSESIRLPEDSVNELSRPFDRSYRDFAKPPEQRGGARPRMHSSWPYFLGSSPEAGTPSDRGLI